MASLSKAVLQALRASSDLQAVAAAFLPALAAVATPRGWGGQWLRGAIHVRGEHGNIGFAPVSFEQGLASAPKDLPSTTAWNLMAEQPGVVHVDVVRGRARGGDRERPIRAAGTQSALLARDTSDVLALPVLDLRGQLRGMVALELRLGSRERDRQLHPALAQGPELSELVEAATPWILGCAADEVERMARKVAGYDVTVLLLGEMGTGKTRLARLIHQWSQRTERPLVEVNLGAMPSSMVASNLFGSVAGAFTGAVQRKGLLESAHRSSLFLDEIGKLDLNVQTALLDVLERRGYRPLGDTGSKTQQPDIRFILATNADLSAMVSAGTFLPDLLQRVNVFPIEVPPLRRRAAEIPVLASRKLAELAPELNVVSLELSPDAAELLQLQPWPGNVRQLEVILLRAAIEAIGAERQRVEARDVAWALARDRGAAPREQVFDVMREAARAYARELRGREQRGLPPVGLEPLSAMRGLVLSELEREHRAETGMDEVAARRRSFRTLGELGVIEHANESREWRKEQARVVALREVLATSAGDG